MLDRTVDRERALKRSRLLGLWLPLGLLAVVVAVQVALLPRLPDPAAVHWGASGAADGWGPGWSFPLLTALVGGGVVALTAVASQAGRARHNSTLDLRFVSAMNLWLVGFLGSLMLVLVAIQVGLDDASDVAMPLWMLLPSLAIGIVLGLLGWFLTPRVEGDDLSSTTPDAVTVRPGEQVVWLRTVSMSRVALAVMLAALASSLAVLVIALFAVEATAETWIIGGTALLVCLLAVAFTVFHIRVDATGLGARSAFGWPRVHIPLEEIESIDLVEINPLGDFGGWGWRYNPGHGQGIVLRSGEALRVTRTNGKLLTVTIDDAATAAALLRGLKDRNRA